MFSNGDIDDDITAINLVTRDAKKILTRIIWDSSVLPKSFYMNVAREALKRDKLDIFDLVWPLINRSEFVEHSSFQIISRMDTQCFIKHHHRKLLLDKIELSELIKLSTRLVTSSQKYQKSKYEEHSQEFYFLQINVHGVALPKDLFTDTK